MRTHAGKEREHVTVRSKGLVDKMVESEVENESEPADEGEAARRYRQRKVREHKQRMVEKARRCETCPRGPASELLGLTARGRVGGGRERKRERLVGLDREREPCPC